MSWVAEYLDRLTKKQTRRQMQDSVGLFFLLGIMMTLTILEGRVDRQFPESQTTHSIAFWMACIGAPISFLTVIANGLALYRNRNRKSAVEPTS